MKTPQWLCLADARTCRLLRVDVTDAGRLHLEKIDSLGNQHEDDKQHRGSQELARLVERGRPSQDDGGNFKTIERRRFAKDAASWITRHIDRQSIDNLHLFAASSMIGEIRHAAGKRMWKHTIEHEADLNSIPQGELAKHPTVKSALGAA